MAYTSWSVVFGEQPSAAKWNILGTNDASFNDGTGIADGVITSEKLKSTVSFRGTITQSIGNASQIVITTYTENHDLGSDFNPATGKFTAPYAGIYHFDAGVQINNTNGRVIIWLNINSGTLPYRSEKHSSSGTADISTELSIDIQLAANDTVGIDVLQETGSSVVPTTSYFSGHLVGKL